MAITLTEKLRLKIDDRMMMVGHVIAPVNTVDITAASLGFNKIDGAVMGNVKATVSAGSTHYPALSEAFPSGTAEQITISGISTANDEFMIKVWGW